MKKQYVSSLYFALFTLISLLIGGCSDEGMNPEVPETALGGYFIINEGAFNNATTSLSYYDREADSVYNNIFKSTADDPLGDQTQSMSIYNGLGYVQVQNSNKIEVMNVDDFSSVATIGFDAGIVSPRYFVGIDESKGYVTDWGLDGISGTIKVVDLNTYEVLDNIITGAGPNKMLKIGDQVYVANSGGYGHDSTVMSVDTQSDAIVDTIQVGHNPNALVEDVNGDIWVTGSGYLSYDFTDYSVIEEESYPGFIAKITNGEVSLLVEGASIYDSYNNLCISNEGTSLYFSHGGAVYEMNINDEAIPEEPFINESFYGLAVDPVSGEILAGEAPNFTDNGYFHRYSTDGTLIKTYTVGIGPNGFAF